MSGADDITKEIAEEKAVRCVVLVGMRLVNGGEFNENSGTSIQLASGEVTGDILEVVTYGTFVLSNQSLTDMTDMNEQRKIKIKNVGKSEQKNLTQ